MQIHIETAAPMFNGGPDEWVETDAQIFDAGHPNRMVHDLVQRLTDPDPHVSEIVCFVRNIHFVSLGMLQVVAYLP